MSIVFQGVDRCVPGLLCVNFEVVNHRKLQKILRALCSHFFESNDCLNFHISCFSFADSDYDNELVDFPVPNGFQNSVLVSGLFCWFFVPFFLAAPS